MTTEEIESGNIIIEAMMADGMSKQDISEAFDLRRKGHDILIAFLNDDEDDDSVTIMISWQPMTEKEKADEKLHEELYGNWKEVLKANREGTLP